MVCILVVPQIVMCVVALSSPIALAAKQVTDILVTVILSLLKRKSKKKGDIDSNESEI